MTKYKTKEINVEVEGNNLVGKLCYESFGLKEKPLMILCHGIPAGNAQEEKKGQDGGYPALAEQCVKNGFVTFYFNFRGTGLSHGNFDLKGWTKDLKGCLDFLEEKGYAGDKGFYLWGFSAGAAVSTYLAAKDSRIKALVLAACPARFENLFPKEEKEKIITELRSRGIIRDPWFPRDYFEWLENIYEINPNNHIDKINETEKLIVHGSKDELISLNEAYELYECAKEPKKISVIDGGKHQLRRNHEAVDICLNWFKTLS